MDDLNYLYQRQQVSLMAAESAVTTEGRLAHSALARAYGRRIDTLRAEMRAPAHAAG